MLYYYYSKRDSHCERIDKHECGSYGEALSYFSQKKNLNEEQFKELFVIETIYTIKVE
jgi:hypothetical protein